MKNLLKVVLITAMISSCSYKAIILQVPKGSYSCGVLRIKTDTITKTLLANVYVKGKKLKVNDTVRIRGNKVTKVIGDSKNE